MAMHAGDLRPRVHDRGPGPVLHALARNDCADLIAERLDLTVVGRQRLDGLQCQRPRQFDALIVGDPRLEQEAAARLEIGAHCVALHHCSERERDVGDVGHDRAFGGDDRLLGREYSIHAESLHEPSLLVLGLVAGTRHRPGVSHGPRQLGFPAADHARHHRLVEVDAVLVIAAGLGIEHRGFAARVVLERVGEIARGIVDVDVLAGRDQGRRSPAFGCEILGDRCCEPAGVGKNRDRTFEQDLLGTVTSECAANAHAVPGIRHAEAIGSENVDAVRLTQRPDLAGVMHRDLLGDHDDFFEIRVHSDQLGDAVADAGRRQVNDAGIEGMPRIETLANVVVHGDVADRCR